MTHRFDTQYHTTCRKILRTNSCRLHGLTHTGKYGRKMDAAQESAREFIRTSSIENSVVFRTPKTFILSTLNRLPDAVDML